MTDIRHVARQAREQRELEIAEEQILHTTQMQHLTKELTLWLHAYMEVFQKEHSMTILIFWNDFEISKDGKVKTHVGEKLPKRDATNREIAMVIEELRKRLREHLGNHFVPIQQAITEAMRQPGPA